MKELKFTLLFLLSINILNSQVITDSLSCYLPFSSDSFDQSANGNNAVVNGATPTMDRFGNENAAFFLDGVTDYIKICNSNLELSYNTTISFWFNPANTLNETNSPEIFLQSDVPGDTDGHFLIGFNRTNCLNFPSTQDGKINFEVQGDQVNANSINCSAFGLTRVSSTTTQWENDQWYMVTLVVESNKLLIYINSELENSNPTTSGVFVKDQDLIIGGYIDFEPQEISAFHGSIDDILIYNRALNAEEIQDIFEDTTTETSDLHHNQSINAFPNPFSNNINLEFDSPNQNSTKLEVYDVFGHLILTDDIKVGNYKLSNLKEKGTYLLLFKNNSGKLIASKKIFKM